MSIPQDLPLVTTKMFEYGSENIHLVKEKIRETLVHMIQDEVDMCVFAYYVGVLFTYGLFFPREIISLNYIGLFLIYVSTYSALQYCKAEGIFTLSPNLMGFYIFFDFYLIICHLMNLAKFQKGLNGKGLDHGLGQGIVYPRAKTA